MIKMSGKIFKIIKKISSSMREGRENKDLLDSFSPNQFKTKLKINKSY